MKLNGRVRKIALACCDNSLRSDASDEVKRCLPMKISQVGAIQKGQSLIPWIEFEGGLIYCPFREPTGDEISTGIAE